MEIFLSQQEWTISINKGVRKMSKKITIEEFKTRFIRNYPNSNIEIIQYTAISNPAIIKCKCCGKIYKKQRAREFLSGYKCCGANNERKTERLIEIYNQSQEFDFIKKVDKDHFIVHHNICGQDLQKTIAGALDNPFACKYCNTISRNQKLDIKEVQAQLNTKFFNEIQILDYNGQLEKNHYKCLRCGLIFTQKHICLLQSRGCPKCDRFKSNGEKKIAHLLNEHNIVYKEQVSVPELPLQHFDFAVYDDNNKIKYFIEVQGEQHFEKREIFRDSLNKIQERDDRKRQYCLSNNIPLYELIYKKGEFKNLDILPL